MENGFDFRHRPTNIEVIRSEDALSVLINELRDRFGKTVHDDLKPFIKNLKTDDAALDIIGGDPAEKNPKYAFVLTADKICQQDRYPFMVEKTKAFTLVPEETAALLMNLGPEHLQSLVHCTVFEYWQRTKRLCREGRQLGHIENPREFLLPRYKTLKKLVQTTLNGSNGHTS